MMTDAVGSYREFEDLERVRVIPEGDAPALAKALRELSVFRRNFQWAHECTEAYSIDTAAVAISAEIHQLAVPIFR